MSFKDINDFQQKYALKDRPHAVPVPGTAKEGYSPVYRNKALGPHAKLLDSVSPQLNTLSKLFANAVKEFGDNDCIGYRRFHNTQKNKFDNFYTYESYATVDERKHNIGSGIVYFVQTHRKYNKNSIFINGKPDFTVSLLSPNRYEWLLVDIATRDLSITNTALYPTLGANSSKYILELTESPIIFLTKDQIPKILKLKSEGNLPDLNVIVSFDDFNHDDHDFFTKADDLDITLVDFRAVEKTGERNQLPRDFNPPTPDTVYTISFTSGTTGNPKGVVLTHRIASSGMMSAICGIERPVSRLNLKKFMDFSDNTDDSGEQITALCALPLAHIYERQCSNYALSLGYRLGMLSSTDPAFFFDDVRASKPHYLCSVPRVWNKLEAVLKQTIQQQWDPNMTSKLLKGEYIPPADKLLVVNHLRKAIGFQNMKFITSGSAPIGTDTITFLRSVLDVGLMVAYGSTESFAGVLYGDAFESKITNSSGPPFFSCEIKLRSLPSMGYHAEEGGSVQRGELMLRGPQIFKEYYKNREETKKSFDDEGFFHTGDVAAMDSNGRLYIIDRVKNFFKLAQGEYVTPEKIENIYLANSPILTQVFVHGDSLRNYLVGVAGISPEYVIKMLKQNHNITVNQEGLLLLLKDPKFKRVIIQELNKHVSKCDLQGFEKIHNLHIDFEPLKIEDEVLTPTLKLKRENAKKKFATILKQLYEEGSYYKNDKI